MHEAREEEQRWRQRVLEVEAQVETLERARDSFKAQFLEIREINKDLRN